MGMFFHSEEEDSDEVIERMVNDRYPSKIGFSSFNADTRDQYRSALREGMELGKSLKDIEE